MLKNRKKILFLIHDLGQGGAEKVLVNLVNNMDLNQFDVTVISLFGGGVNEKFLHPEVHYKSIFSKMPRGNSQMMKILSPSILHKWFITEKYDIEISYLEGPSARIISGCQDEDTKLVSWIHVEQHLLKNAAHAFRTEAEAIECYNKFNKVICVSEFVKNDFCAIFNCKKEPMVLYNTIETNKIKELATEKQNILAEDQKIRLVAVGTLKESKGYARMLNIIRKLYLEGYPVHLYILGEGPMKEAIIRFISENKLEAVVTLLGYQINPYKFVSECDLFICASFAEGFSTAVTEALILGVPVCTVNVSGMKELLGENNEYGIVTENDETELYNGIKIMLDNERLFNYYKTQAVIRGRNFETKNTVNAVEEMLLSCLDH